MTEIKSPVEEDNEKTITRLKNENTDLRKRIKELQKINASLREQLSIVEEKPPIVIEEEKSLKVFEKKEKSGSIDSGNEQEQTVTLKELEIKTLSDFETPSVPLSTESKSIMMGDSRRMCPKCDNTQTRFIYEEIDRTHIIMDYPRMYGKKYKCGKCGQEWRVPTSFE